MATESKQPKGILKNTISETSSSSKIPSAEEAKEIAIHHAKLLQHRKDLETEILDSLVLLSEYPLVRTPRQSAQNPAPSDVSGFKTHVRLFQPSDYDDLIEERNVNGLCGYTLCPKSKREVGPGGEWKITGGDIVKRRDIERWCSSACAKRALFVKVQLNESAAWERAGIPDIQIDLLDEDMSGETEADRTARQMGHLKLEDQRQATRDAQALALERGARGNNADPDKVKVELRERETQAPKSDDEDEENPRTDVDHLMVEGHKIELPRRPKQSS